MRPNPTPLIAIGLFCSFFAGAQNYELLLKSGNLTPTKNISVEGLEHINSTASRTAGKTFAIIQFEEIPNETRRQQLVAAGIELLDYIPDNAYTVTITGKLDPVFLQQVKARAVVEPTAVQKMRSDIAKGDFPAWAVKTPGTVDVWISFPRTFSFESVKADLMSRNFQILDELHKQYRIISVRVPVTRLGELALFPFIAYVEPIPPPDRELNYNSMYASRANVLKAPVAFGGKNLNGAGVVVGVGDNGDIQTHLDLSGRLINRSGEVWAAHATHVAGTIGGGGFIRELYTGYATKATLIPQYFFNIVSNAPAYVQDHGMVISNNSYGSVVSDCFYNGLYDLSSTILDQQAFDLDELLHVFASGNNGSLSCAPYPFGFKTVLGGYQASKNVLTVGSVDYKSDVSGFSSKGPVRDGRVKPEIMSQGEFVASTWTHNIYSYNNGTSMAAPGVSGGLALLIQQYRIQHASNPKSSLMKAIMINGSSDRGNRGPDYSYGFGRMNLLRSSAIIENGTYFTGSLVDDASSLNGIVVPANTAQLRVTLYWPDPPAAMMSSKTLVNDLDLEVVTPSGTVLPLILDSTAGNVAIAAVPGVDRRNNTEQVLIDDPVAGNYSLNVLATTVAQNPTQQFYLVYDIIPKSIVLTNPVGGEGFVPSFTFFDSIYIQWDSYGDTTSTYTLEFTSDVPASNWSESVPANKRIYSWGVPNITTATGQIKITKNLTGATQTSLPFTITPMPVITLDPVQCEGYINISWNAVPGATDYEVFIFRGDTLVLVETTTNLNYAFSGLSKDTLYWVTMRPRVNGKPGMRAWALSRKPNDGSCAGNISNNDLKIDTIISPSVSGRIFTSTALGNAIPVTIRIKNLDDVVSSGNIDLSYSINAGPPVSFTLTPVTVPSSAIPALSTIDYTFTAPVDLSAVGTYSFEFTVTKASDPVTANNSITKVIKQLDNQPFVIGDLPWLDNLESSGVHSSTVDEMGLPGRDRYDFVNSSDTGRIRTFINSGIAYSGSKALTLDGYIFNSGTTDSLSGTFNLGNFDVNNDDMRLDFRYKNHGQKTNPANSVWIRGSDMDNWIRMYDLFANQNPANGTYKLSSSLELSDSLDAHGQIFTSSFQVRWGQWGRYMAADDDGFAGYSFDDIRIYRAVDDIEMVSIDQPDSINCGLSSTEQVVVTVRNRSNVPITGVPLSLYVDGIFVGTENTGLINGSATISFTFTTITANLSAIGVHTIEVRANYATDNVEDNDTVRLVLRNLPMVTSFPYLQNFESGDGSWYTDSTNSSWQYGTPVSPKVSRAASGTKAWKTNRAGYYLDKELSYLYSPCFNISGMTNPTLSFSLSLNIEDCGGVLCDAAWVEYSVNGGTTWSRLGAMGTGTNWYNRNFSGNHAWSQHDYHRWHVATTPLPTPASSNIRFRFVFSSDESVNRDGIAVDDIHIYDNIYGIYDVVGESPEASHPNVDGNNWINFIDVGTNKLIASINPLNQDLDETKVKSYVHTGPVRVNSDQYYHNRNITIKPTNVNLPDSVLVRFYFLDSETEALINATGCSYCFKPSMAYELGVTKYSDIVDTRENGTLSDNIPGNYIFIPSANAVKVPFDKGYYAEFKVKDFSEFWLNNGGFNLITPLPVQLLSFTARKQNGTDVLAEWKTASEFNVDRFEIEVARGNDDYLQNRYTKIGEVRSGGNSTTEQTYRFIDTETGKSGVRYYRLKIVDIDDKFSYSMIRPVTFNSEMKWHVSPNPSNGIFQLHYQVNAGEEIHIRVYDLNGKTVKQLDLRGDGFVQRQTIDLSGSGFAKGMYMLEAFTDGKKEVFRLVSH